MPHRRGSPDAGAAHPASQDLQIDLFPKSAEERSQEAEAQANANITKLLQPFTQELATHATQPEILRERGKELLQFVFAARGLTKSGKPEDIFAGRKALAAAEKTLKNYQKALTAAKAETLNPAKDYTHDSGKMSELTQAIRDIVPKEFTFTGFWKGEPFGAHPRIPAEAPRQPSTEPVAEPEAKKNKPPLRLEDGIEPLPDSAIGDIEEGPPPVHDEIPSLEPTTTKHIEAEKDAPPQRFDLEDLGLDEVRVMKHTSTLSDEDLLSDRDAVTLAEAPKGFGTEHDRIVAEVKRRMAKREATRLAKAPEHTPEQRRTLAGSRSHLENPGTDDLSKGDLLNTDLRRAVEMNTGSETLSRRIKDVEARLERLEAEYHTIGFTWFNQAKRERKRQIEGAIEANKALLTSLKETQRREDLEDDTAIVEAPAEVEEQTFEESA